MIAANSHFPPVLAAIFSRRRRGGFAVKVGSVTGQLFRQIVDCVHDITGRTILHGADLCLSRKLDGAVAAERELYQYLIRFDVSAAASA